MRESFFGACPYTDDSTPSFYKLPQMPCYRSFRQTFELLYSAIPKCPPSYLYLFASGHCFDRKIDVICLHQITKSEVLKKLEVIEIGRHKNKGDLLNESLTLQLFVDPCERFISASAPSFCEMFGILII